jgi:hypothetical protein
MSPRRGGADRQRGRVGALQHPPCYHQGKVSAAFPEASLIEAQPREWNKSNGSDYPP